MEGSVQLPFSSAVTADIFLQITSTLSHLSSLYNRSSQTLTGSHCTYTYTPTPTAAACTLCHSGLSQVAANRTPTPCYTSLACTTGHPRLSQVATTPTRTPTPSPTSPACTTGHPRLSQEPPHVHLHPHPLQPVQQVIPDPHR
jgi:hypothetical protein